MEQLEDCLAATIIKMDKTTLDKVDHIVAPGEELIVATWEGRVPPHGVYFYAENASLTEPFRDVRDEAHETRNK